MSEYVHSVFRRAPLCFPAGAPLLSVATCIDASSFKHSCSTIMHVYIITLKGVSISLVVIVPETVAPPVFTNVFTGLDFTSY